MKLRTHCFSDRRGATVVETAFVLMIALTLTLAIYDYGRYFMLSQLVNNAAREGARQAVANTNTQNTAMIQNTVVQYLANQNFKDSSGNAFSASDVVVIQVNPDPTGPPRHPTATGTTRLSSRPSWSRSMPSLLPFSRDLGFCQRP